MGRGGGTQKGLVSIGTKYATEMSGSAFVQETTGEGLPFPPLSVYVSIAQFLENSMAGRKYTLKVCPQVLNQILNLPEKCPTCFELLKGAAHIRWH